MKKVGMIVLTLVLALGVLGVGFAAWSQTLTINGNVSTGTYDVVFQNVVASETDPYSLATSTTTVTNVTDHSFDVTVANGYPGYIGVATFDVKNTGSVPAVITLLSVTGGNATDFSNVVAGIATGDKLAVGAAKTACTVTITIAAAATETNPNQTFTVTFDTDQGI